jgi:hypothetical protein
MHTNDHFLLPRCTGMNCGATDANHSPECRAEHAAAVAGGRFVKDEKRAADDAERERFEAWAGPHGYNLTKFDGQYAYQNTHDAREGWQAALSARADGGKDSSDAQLGAYVRRLHGMLGRQVEAFYDNIDAAIAKEKK